MKKTTVFTQNQNRVRNLVAWVICTADAYQSAGLRKFNPNVQKESKGFAPFTSQAFYSGVRSPWKEFLKVI